MRWAAAGVTVPVSHRFRSAHALWGRAGTGVCVPSGGMAHRGAQPGGRWGAAHRVPGWVCPGSGCGGRSRAQPGADPAGGVGPSPGLHLLRAVLRDPHGRGAAAGQPGAGHPPVCSAGAGRVSYRRSAEPSAPGTRCPGTLCAVHPDCAAPVGRSNRTGGCAVPEIVRIRVVFPDASSRVRAVSARRVGTLPGHAAGGVLRLRLCGPHRPVGQQSVLRRPQRTGSIGAAAGAYPLPRRSVLPSAAGRSVSAPAAVAGIVLPDMAGTGRGDLWQPVRTGDPHAAGAAGLCAAGLCRVLHGGL